MKRNRDFWLNMGLLVLGIWGAVNLYEGVLGAISSFTIFDRPF
jgi:hypothetical protein